VPEHDQLCFVHAARDLVLPAVVADVSHAWRPAAAATRLADGDHRTVLRHFSTVFAYNDAMWAKYGAIMSQRSNFSDPQSQKPATINVYNSASHAAARPSLGNTLDSVLNRGVHLAVCQMASRLFAGGLATPPEVLAFWTTRPLRHERAALASSTPDRGRPETGSPCERQSDRFRRRNNAIKGWPRQRKLGTTWEQ